jgi:enoyl-CoA hydratase/carnithine racemase
VTITRSNDDGIGTILMDRPRRKNALQLEDWEALASAIADADADDDVRAIILTSAQPGLFCAGADIADIAAHHEDAEWRARKYEAVQACNRGLWSSDKPVIAAIDGDCIGGGCGLALACDIRIAAPHARFGVTPAKLGIAYARFDTALLVAAVGIAQARRLLITADLIDAPEALRIGLVQEVTADPLLRARAMAQKMIALSAHSIAVSKHHLRTIQRGVVDEDADSRDLFIASYAREGFGERLEAFLKRG